DPLLLPVLWDLIQALQTDYNSMIQMSVATTTTSISALSPSGTTASDPFLPLALSKGKEKALLSQDMNMKSTISTTAPTSTFQHSLVKDKPAHDSVPPK